MRCSPVSIRSQWIFSRADWNLDLIPCASRRRLRSSTLPAGAYVIVRAHVFCCDFYICMFSHQQICIKHACFVVHLFFLSFGRQPCSFLRHTPAKQERGLPATQGYSL